MVIETAEICCCKCKITWWITKDHNNELLKDHNGFYCPNGHVQHYIGKTEAQKNKEEAERYKNWYREKRDENERLARSNSALRGVITRKKKQKKGI